MNTFVDGWPVYSKAFASSGRPAPVHVARIPMEAVDMCMLSNSH
jgi:hypothetical protein